jgi:hypothetical protein
MNMRFLHSSAKTRHWMCLVFIVMLLTTGCDRSTPPPTGLESGEVRHFTGTWTATGNRQTMQLEPGHQAAVFRFSGSLLLTGTQRLTTGFKAEVIGFTDNLSGSQGRSVWTDEQGDKVFSELHGESIKPGKLIKGKFLGGTGRFTGVTGEYSFKWQSLVQDEDGDESGRVVDLQGWARLGSQASKPLSSGGQQ